MAAYDLCCELSACFRLNENNVRILHFKIRIQYSQTAVLTENAVCLLKAADAFSVRKHTSREKHSYLV